MSCLVFSVLPNTQTLIVMIVCCYLFSDRTGDEDEHLTENKHPSVSKLWARAHWWALKVFQVGLEIIFYKSK